MNEEDDGAALRYFIAHPYWPDPPEEEKRRRKYIRELIRKYTRAYTKK